MIFSTGLCHSVLFQQTASIQPYSTHLLTFAIHILTSRLFFAPLALFSGLTSSCQTCLPLTSVTHLIHGNFFIIYSPSTTRLLYALFIDAYLFLWCGHRLYFATLFPVASIFQHPRYYRLHLCVCCAATGS